MRHKPIRVYFTAAIAVMLLSLGQGMSILHPSPLATAAPNPQTNPHYTAAISRLEQEDLQGAMAELNQAIQIDPSLSEAYALRGVLFMGEKNFQEAAEDFAQVTQLQPKSAEAHLNLAKSQMMLKDYKAALQSATTAKEIDPKNKEAALLSNLAQRLVESSQ